MPKTIKTDKELVGKFLSQENVKVGLRVEASKNWKYGTQGDYGLGTVTSVFDAREQYGLDCDYVTVLWDNDDTNSYPLDEQCLSISDGKVKKTSVSKFLEKAKLWDVFKVLTVSDCEDIKMGDLFQIIEVKQKTFTIQPESFEGMDVVRLVIDSPTLDRMTVRKQANTLQKANRLISDFADYVETPKTNKEYIVKHITDRFKDVREFLNVHDSNMYNTTVFDRYAQIAANINLKVEGSFKTESIFGDSLIFERTNHIGFRITSSAIKQYFIKNISSSTSKTYKEWLSDIEKVNSRTMFSSNLKNVILQSNCNEKLKTFFSEGIVKIDENLIDFDRATKKIQYTPKGKPVQFDNYGEPAGVRQTMSPHKFFGKYFKDFEGISEYEVKCFADEVISTFGEYKIMEIEDGKIGEFYNNLKTVTSCMTGKGTDMLRLYDDNPQVFKMFAITLNGEVVARMLRVNAFEYPTHKPFVYFDRLYFDNKHTEVVQWFNNYCTNNNINRKSENSATCIDEFYNKEKGGTFRKKIYVPIPSVERDFEHVYRILPYLDTLRFGMFGVLTNNNVGRMTIEGKFKNVPIRYTFDRAGSEYANKGYKGYCAINEGWTTENVVTITHAEGKYEKYIGCTVQNAYATKTEKGYTIN